MQTGFLSHVIFLFVCAIFIRNIICYLKVKNVLNHFAKVSLQTWRNCIFSLFVNQIKGNQLRLKTHIEKINLQKKVIDTKYDIEN